MSARVASLFKKKKKKGKFSWWSSQAQDGAKGDRVSRFRRWCVQVGLELHPHVSGLQASCSADPYDPLCAADRSLFRVRRCVMGWGWWLKSTSVEGSVWLSFPELPCSLAPTRT